MAAYDQILSILNTVPGQRIVMQVELQGRPCVARVFLRPVQLAFDPLVREAALAGRGSIQGLPEELALPLEGYRVRASLGRIDSLPDMVAAGVGGFALPGLPAPSPPFGYPYVTTRWIEGDSLREARGRLPYAGKVQVLAGILQLLGALHEQLVAYGDLKPHNVVLVDGNDPWLIDLDTLRHVSAADVPTPTRDLTPAFAAPEQVAQRLTYLASDVFAFGRLAAWLLQPELADGAERPGLAAWRSAIAACLDAEPDRRPTCPELHWTYLLARPSALVPAPVADSPGESPPAGPVPAGRDTELVADGPMPTQTVFVPDLDEPVAQAEPTPPAPPVPRRRGLVLALVAAAAAAIGGLLAWRSATSSPAAASAARPGELAAAAPSPDGGRAGPQPFDLCLGEDPQRVAVTYLRPGEPVPTGDQLRAWFPGIDPGAVRVYALRYPKKPADRNRFVALELSRDSWPEWATIAGSARGEELCWRIGRALVDRGIGRPGDQRRRGDGYEFDIITGRAAATEEEMLGTLAAVLAGDGYQRMSSWMRPSGLTGWTVAWRLLDPGGQLGPVVGQTRLPASFDQDWGDGPILQGRADYLSFTATASLNLPRPARITVILGSDDGGRLEIDGEMVLDRWRQADYQTLEGTIDLDAGVHTLTLHYYEMRGQARVSFDYYLHAEG